MDPRYIQEWASDRALECTQAPHRIPAWILPHALAQDLFINGQGVAPDLIYTRGVPDTPHRDIDAIDRKKCALILVEISFCQDLSLDKRLEEKTLKYTPLVAALKTIWGRVELIVVPIGHAGTVLDKTYKSIATALSATRPEVALARASRGAVDPDTDHAARAHDMSLFKGMLDAITRLAQDRLLGIIHRRQRLVNELPGAVSRHRAHSAATPAHVHHQHPHGTHQQGAATHTLSVRTTRIPEMTAIR